MVDLFTVKASTLDLQMSPVIEFYQDKPNSPLQNTPFSKAYFYDPSVVISNQRTHFSTNVAQHIYEPTSLFLLSIYPTRNATNMFPNQFRYVSRRTPNTFFEPIVFEPPIVLGDLRKIKGPSVDTKNSLEEEEEEELAYTQEPEPTPSNESEIVHLLKDFHIIKL